jgi:alpha-tubulin suppressor-like RCC1 family protein
VSGLPSRRVAAVACGWASSVVLYDDGTLHGWGRGLRGTLRCIADESARGDTANDEWRCYDPSGTAAPLTWGLDVAASDKSTDKKAKASDKKPAAGSDVALVADLAPRKLPLPPGAKLADVRCGSHHVALVGAAGELWVTGCGRDGQLGLGDGDSRAGPVRVELPGSAKVRAVALAELHTIVLGTDGDVWTFGNGECGQLGVGEGVER